MSGEKIKPSPAAEAAMVYQSMVNLVEDAKAALLDAQKCLAAAEEKLLDAITEIEDERVTAVLVDGVAYEVPEEYWERAPGDRIRRVHVEVMR